LMTTTRSMTKLSWCKTTGDIWGISPSCARRFFSHIHARLLSPANWFRLIYYQIIQLMSNSHCFGSHF
jgi:hypothetical protein